MFAKNLVVLLSLMFKDFMNSTTVNEKLIYLFGSYFSHYLSQPTCQLCCLSLIIFRYFFFKSNAIILHCEKLQCVDVVLLYIFQQSSGISILKGIYLDNYV